MPCGRPGHGIECWWGAVGGARTRRSPAGLWIPRSPTYIRFGTANVWVHFSTRRAEKCTHTRPNRRDSFLSRYLSAAFRWAVARTLVDPAVRISTTAHLLARTRLRTETFGRCEEVIGLARDAEHRLLPSVLAGASDSVTTVGSVDDAVRFGLEAVSLNDDARYDPDPLAYVQTGFALMTRGDVYGSLRVLWIGAQHPADRVTRVNLGYLHALGRYRRRPVSR